jgi:hypothetical protein
VADKPDKPEKDDEKTPATGESGGHVHPDGMNPHVVPEKDEKEAGKD